MAIKDIIFGTNVPRQKEDRLNSPANAVEANLEPNGRNIVFDRSGSTLNVTEEGVTVAKEKGNNRGSTKRTKGSCERGNTRLAWTEAEWNGPIREAISRVRRDPGLLMLKEPRSEPVPVNRKSEVGNIVSESHTGDGLHSDRPNGNQGAESTLSFLLALVVMRLAIRTARSDPTNITKLKENIS